MSNIEYYIGIFIASMAEILLVLVVMPNFSSTATASQMRPSTDFSLAPQSCCGGDDNGNGEYDQP